MTMLDPLGSLDLAVVTVAGGVFQDIALGCYGQLEWVSQLARHASTRSHAERVQ
ncbi:MAG: hypothetical protein NXI22_03040 [bacterium]|nr:hypothetical protein [bacterium]